MPLLCRDIQMQLRPQWCRHVLERQAPIAHTCAGAALDPRGVDMSWCSTELCSVDTSRYSFGVWPYGVDISMQKQLRLLLSRHVQVQLRNLWSSHLRSAEL
jgi:hypothetical protein